MHTNFGEFLVQRRLKSDISAKWLAEALGISQVYMCDIEKGRRRMSDEMLKRLSELLLLSEEERYEMYDLAAKSYRDTADSHLHRISPSFSYPHLLWSQFYLKAKYFTAAFAGDCQ